METKSLCNKCRNKLKKEYKFERDDYNTDISKNFIEHYYFFKYKNLIREQILGIKFNEKAYNCQTLSYFLENMKKSFEKLKKYDIIIVVPVSKKRQKDRGYNQTEIIAQKISKILNINIKKHILYKTKNTVPQSTLNKEQREENAKDAYIAKNCKKIANKRILLIDDIYTTGSTVNECAKTLIDSGIEKEQIGVLTIAKD